LILLRSNQAIKAAHDRFNADIEDESGGAALSAALRIRGFQIFAVPGNDQMYDPGAKQVFIHKDMKEILIDGEVADVQ
jgi:hypothetical protein